jgi:protein TonB
MGIPIKPIRYDDSVRPKDVQFKHFGVMDAGAQSKGSMFTSIVINALLALIVIVIGAATRKVVEDNSKMVTLVAPVPLKEPEPLRPKLPPPPPPKLPPTPKIEPPKIRVPEEKLPEPPKVPVVKMNQPAPINLPAPPKRVTPPAAPTPVNLGRPAAASIPNHDAHPTAVRLGTPDNPIAASNRPAVASVNLGNKGMPGMPASNVGSGPAASKVNLGSGQPGSQSLTGNGTRQIAGVKLGQPGGTGPMNSTGRNAAVAGPVNLGVQTAQVVRPTTLAARPAQTGPKVIYKPKPDYTAEARAQHIEGTVSVRLRVSATGVVTVLGVSNGLGHGLNESALRAVQATRFQPALDATGHPVDWEGTVNVAFQLAG